MKIENISILFTVFLLCAPIQGQTNFIYDQQSADDNHILEGGTGIEQTIGQTFTPTLPAVGFIRLYIYNGTGGATIHVNLYANPTNGALLGSTAPVLISGSFAYRVNFIFTNPIPVIPGTKYFFRPIVNNNNLGLSQSQSYNYPGGEVYYQGTAYPTYDFWFREGIIAPKIFIELTNSKPLLRFPTISNLNYSVEYSPDLNSGSWSNLLGTNIQGTGQDAAVLDTNVTMSINRFYRLKLFP